MRLISLISTFAAAGLLLTANAVAAPITFKMTLPGASGVNNSVPFAFQNVVIVVQADTSAVFPVPILTTPTASGNCVAAISTSITVGGSAPVQAASPMYFCATPDAFFTGVFSTANVASPNSYYFIADYSNAGITNFVLATNFPLTVNRFGNTAQTTLPLNLAGGGTASLTFVSPGGSTFSATLGAVTVPTLGQLGLAALATLLALAGMAAPWQRKST